MSESVRLIVSMGIPCKDFESKQEGHKYDQAIIQVLDWNSKKVEQEVSYISPDKNLGDGLSLQFKGATVSQGKLYVVTNTEVLIYDRDTWRLLSVFSDPTFNDLHGVLPWKNNLYVCNTGLEVVQVLDEQTGKIIKTYDLASGGIYQRFGKSVDFRRQGSTKPHKYHINHLFVKDNEVWVTYGNKCKSVALSNSENELFFRLNEGDEESIILGHDGLMKGAFIYFTTVNGHLVLVDSTTKEIHQDIDLNKIIDGSLSVGWTRGVEVIGDYAYVGITKPRHSKFKEYSKWLLKKKAKALPSGILKINLKNERVDDFFEMKNHQGHAIYSILHDDSI